MGSSDRKPTIVRLENPDIVRLLVEASVDQDEATTLALNAAGQPPAEGVEVVEVLPRHMRLAGRDEAPDESSLGSYWIECKPDEPGATPCWYFELDCTHAETDPGVEDEYYASLEQPDLAEAGEDVDVEAGEPSADESPEELPTRPSPPAEVLDDVYDGLERAVDAAAGLEIVLLDVTAVGMGHAWPERFADALSEAQTRVTSLREQLADLHTLVEPR